MFTPGPWTDDGWDNFDPEELHPVYVVGHEQRVIIAMVHTEAANWEEARADEQCIANAHLIAAAPDLYEVLSEWHRIAEATGGQSVMRNRVIATLAKARGE